MFFIVPYSNSDDMIEAAVPIKIRPIKELVAKFETKSSLGIKCLGYNLLITANDILTSIRNIKQYNVLFFLIILYSSFFINLFNDITFPFPSMIIKYFLNFLRGLYL